MNKREMDTLMKKVAEGDNDAFAQLYGAAARGVLAFAYSYLRNYADAEDVTEEVFFTVKKKAYLYRAGTDARAWLFQIAKNLSLDELRRRKRRGAVGRTRRSKGVRAPEAASARPDDRMSRRNRAGNRTFTCGLGL